MKTFTNLAHWAAKKCATHGTSNRNRYYLFTIIMLLTLGATTAWAEEVEMSSFTATSADMDTYISYSTAKGGGTSDPAVNSSQIRLYQGSPGGNITITAKEGATITDVTIGSAMATQIRWQVGDGATDGSNTSLAKNATVTKSGLSTSKVTCHCYGSDKNSRLYVNYLKVVYTIEGGSTEIVSTPTFSTPETTFYTSSINVELNCTTEGATIHYTLNGDIPTTSSDIYSEASTTTIKAIAVKDGLTDSEVATATYTKGETITSYDIDFETNALEAYVNWDFTNIAIVSTTITAKEGTYYGNTSRKASASIKTKEKIQYPGTLTFHTSKESSNTTTSSWSVQVSENGTSWTEAASFDATTGSKGTWTERTTDLSDYENVYVQISYSGSTAVRAIDEISLAQGVAPAKYALNITAPSNGTLVVKEGTTEVTSGATFREGTTLTVVATPSTGYKLDGVIITDDSSNDVTTDVYADGTLTIPAYNITISATFSVNEKPAATLTLSKNGVEETFPGSWKQDDVVTLPSITSECVKEFVGWDTDANCNHEPTYAPGAEYTLTAETQTLYAVYADGEMGEASLTKMTSTDALENGDKIVIVAYGTQLGMYQETSGTTYVKYWELASSEPVITELEDDKTIWNVEADGENWKLGDATNGYLYNASSNNLAVSTTNASTWTITWKENGFVFKSDLNKYMACRTDLSASNQNLYRMNGTSIGTSGIYEMNIYKYNEPSASYSNYSTTCAVAPTVEVTPTSVEANAAETTGTITVTYKNVNTEAVTVALFNDAACTEAFTADWLTASIDADKNITYTISATTLYTERKAYIQLTAPESSATTDPAVVVIPVTQAGKDKVFASLEELLAAITPTADGVEVTVTLTNEVIIDFYTSGSYRNGVKLNVPYQGGTKEIEIYCKDVPTDWVKAGKISGTITCPWKIYSSTWELCPTAWTDFTYTAPATVSSIEVSGTPTKTTYVDGEKFNPAGLVVTAVYTDATTEDVTDFADWTVNPETLVLGTTSVSVTATYNTISSTAYEVTGLTVNDIPAKTIAYFISSNGGRCYLEGIVSNITNTTYGNFDLTDASGTIYVYGCLNAEGKKGKFAELEVKNGDKIKVIADKFTVYDNKDQATDVQYVSHKPVATIDVSNITMEVGEPQTISATVTPVDAVVTYAIKAGSDNCITLNGAEITATAAGTATIIATIAETEDYLGITKEFTVTVTTVDTRKKAVSPSSFTATSGELNPNDITFASYQGGAGTAPGKYNNGIRLYQISGTNTYGGYITLEATKGCKIDQVEITTTDQYNTTTVAYSVDGNETLLGSASVAKLSKYSTPAGLNTESVNILNLGAISSNRLEIASIIVYYTGQPLADPELSWTSNTVELRVGETFVAPTLNNPYTVTGITYRSSNESLAKVDASTGVTTLVPDATGTATITATFDGDETYKATEVSYTITVNPELVYGVWELVIDATTLAAGDKVVIAAKDYAFALSATQGNNNRDQAAVIKDNNTISFSADVQVLTLETGTVDNTFALNTGKGYLYAASSSSNHLKTQSNKDANASWEITITDGTASIVAKGTNSRNTMQYNQSSSLFACYSSASQKAVCLYTKKNVKVEGETDNSTIPNQSDVTVDNAELTVTTEAEYDNMYIGNNGSVNVEEEVTVNNLYIQTTMGTTTSGQLNTAPENLIVNGDAFIDITLGDDANPQKWHAFTVPFQVDAMNGIFDLNDNKLTNGVNYAIMQYHGDVRAQGKYGWKKYSGVLVPGTFYLMTVDGARTTYRFKKVKDAALVAENTKSLSAYTGGGKTEDQGWNGVGNPTLMHGKVAFDAQILDPATYTYTLITASSANFTVGTPFFIQAKTDAVVTIATGGNGTLAPARRAATTVDKIKVALGNADYTDYLYVSASEDATNEYEIGKDLVKMVMTNTPIVPQIFAEAYGARLCMVNAPMTSNEATIALNLYAPAEGEYTLSVEEQADATVYLLYNGNIVWNLSMSEYPIHLSQGDNAGYSLVVRRENAPTNVENIFGADNQIEKFIYNGNLYILRDGKLFDAVGNMLK